MTTSNSTIFNPKRNAVIKRSLRLVNAYQSMSEPQPEQMRDALETLNSILKLWQIEGFLWLKQFATLFLAQGQARYSIPGDHCTADYIETTLSESTSDIPQLQIVIGTTSNMTAGDKIGCYLDSGVLFWDLVSSVDGPNDITLTSGIPSLATEGNPVFSYSTEISRPTKISLPYRRVWGGSDLPMGNTGKPLSREEYSALPTKASSGTPLAIYYDPQLVAGSIYLWPVPVDTRDRVVFTCDRPIQDIIKDEDTFDVPQEQIIRIEYALALALAPEYAVPQGDYDRLRQRYDEIATVLSMFDQESIPTQFMFSNR